MPRLSKLFEPGRIGTMEVRNRIVMAPMGTHANTPDGHLTQRVTDFYVERARGGVGLIGSQGTPMMKEARTPERAWIFDDSVIPEFRELSRAVHQGGAKMSIMINHNGRSLLKELQECPWGDEIDPVGPSAVPWVRTGTAPRVATREDIKRMVQAFAEAARRVKEAEFDAVEIQGGHGYLLTSFFSPFTNRRTDEYGGSVENRARFPCEVLAATRKMVGPDYPIIFRFSAADYVHGGITLEDSCRQAPMFVEAGADALSVSASSIETTEWQFPSYLSPPGMLVHLAEAIKRVVKVPIITVGKLGDPVVAERVIEEGKADFVAMGRALLADAALPNKAKEGRLDDIRRCVYCNNCLVGVRERRDIQGVAFQGRSCTVNPGLMREKEFALSPSSRPRKVMVVGGGLAGMETARVLAQRGHHVSLYEKDDKLGGQWNIAAQSPFKEEFGGLTRQLIEGLHEAAVRVTLNKEVTLELVKGERPDVLVIATGAVSSSPPCPGVDGKNVVQAVDVFAGKAEVGQRVVVVGGRLRGMEVADLLADRGKKVSLVTKNALGEDGSPIDRNLYRTLRDRLVQKGVAIFPHSPVYSIRDDGVYVDDNHELMFLEADTVVLAVGARSEGRVLKELEGVVGEVYAIGDCVQPRDALEAMREGAELGRRI